MKLGEFVRKYRKMKLLTQKDMADKLKTSNIQVSKIENGNPTSRRMLRKLSEVMDVDPELVSMMYEEEQAMKQATKEDKQ